MIRTLVIVAALAPSVAWAGIEGHRVERAGSGELPHEADELTYRIDWSWNGGPAERTDRTERGSEIMLNEELRDDLLAMRVGERRRVWGREVNGMACDHFGCAPAEPFTATVELLAVTSHHDELPGGLRIAAHPLRVVDGTASAVLPGDEAWTVREVRLADNRVAIEVTYEPGARRATVTFDLDELRARLADTRAAAAIAHHDTRAAGELLDQALALDRELPDAHVHRALLHRDNDELALAAASDPVWLAWRLRADRSLAPLRALPAGRALDVAGGSITATDVDETSLVVLAEPSGRFLAAEASPSYVGEAMRIIDRASGEIVASIPVGCTDFSGSMASGGSIERCRARSVGARALAAFGFSRTPSRTIRADRGEQIVRVDDLEIRRWILDEPSYVSGIEVHVVRAAPPVTAAPPPIVAPVIPPVAIAPAPAPAPLPWRAPLAPLLLLAVTAALARTVSDRA